MTEKYHIPELLNGAEPIYKQGNSIGVLCLHGLTASPAEMSWYADHLHQQGFTVHVPRLAGHGADYRDLQRITWRDWYLSALDGYHLLSQQCEQVFVTGLSMGGLLSLLIGARHPVTGIIVLGSPIQRITQRPHWFLNLYKWLRPFQHLADNSDFPRRLRAEQLHRGERNLGRVRYDMWAVQVVIELNTLIERVRDCTSSIHKPVCTIYSKSDQTVPFNQSELLHELLIQAQLESHILEHSGHIMTQDSEQETVFNIASDFIQTYSSR